jgi:hypothetical protein
VPRPRRSEDVTRRDDCGDVAPPHTPVVLTLTVEAPHVTRSTRTTEYHCAACIARLDEEHTGTAG